MFKKPLADLKTSAPLRSSDRRKLKQRIIETYSLQPEAGELLVPEGLQSQKFSTHVNEHGVAYLSHEGDPLWFTIGKGSDELIPTVYTLWKHPTLLPFLSTPAAVVPKLVGGADLMIPGVVQHPPNLIPDQLVSITQYHSASGPNVIKVGPPIAVGKMAVSSDILGRSDEGEDVKGKAVLTLHTWKDTLWDMASTGAQKTEVPEPRELVLGDSDAQEEHRVQDETKDEKEAEAGQTEGAVKSEERSIEPASHATDEGSPQSDSGPALTAEDISFCLRSALLQAISTTLASLPPSAFPMPASIFWSNHVLPARPAHALGSRGLADAGAIDVKHSTHKSVKAFLKACAKEGLIKLKETKGDVVVTAVYLTHPAVAGHRSHRTIQSLEAKQQKAEEEHRKEKEAEERRNGEIRVLELWKPHQNTVPLFVAAEKDTSNLYTISDIKNTFDTYVSTKQLINLQDQQYINVGDDSALSQAISIKGEDVPEFLKREELLKRIRDNMQSWYEIKIEGNDVVRKKGTFKPISVVVKIRQGRKAATLVTGFEPYFLKADDLAEELRRLCASSTSVAPLPGKGSAMEVMVQGKQTKAVTNYLLAKGVPKRWIETADLSHDKKK